MTEGAISPLSLCTEIARPPSGYLPVPIFVTKRQLFRGARLRGARLRGIRLGAGVHLPCCVGWCGRSGAVELRPILIMSLSEKKCLFHNQMKVMEG